MNRYKKANEGIHAPEELKEKAAHPAGRRGGYPRWTGAVAAVLVVAIIGGIALWPRGDGGSTADSNGGDIAPLSDDEGTPVEPRSAPDDGENEDVSLTAAGAEAAPVYGSGSHRAMALASAVYQLPDTEEPPWPAWSEFDPGEDASEEERKQADAAWDEAIEAWRQVAYAARYKLAANETIGDFVTASTTRFLTGAGEDNRVYSPLNLYMALAMLAETAGGESRQQILDVLGVDSIEALREDAATVWQNYYEDDDMGISVMANSLWLRDDMTYSQETLDTLAADYYASSFAGAMGSEAYDQALRDWVNEQTRGVLTEQADGLFFDPATVLGLVSTLYFKAAWGTPFSPELNTQDVFHAPSGDVETEFLHGGEWLHGNYYWGEHFSAIRLGFQSSNNYGMWLILPDEGYTVDDLVESGEAMDFLLSRKYGDWDEETGQEVGGWPGKKDLMIDLSLPKFDVSSDIDLTDGLKALGITDVFDGRVSNFDPLGASTDVPLFVNQAQHAARVTIDEEGCTAASYVDLMLVGAGMPPDEVVEFNLNRPFLFAITGNSELPLFMGVVNQP